jgi:drug/metabolite transporter (DMT)-like permease
LSFLPLVPLTLAADDGQMPDMTARDARGRLLSERVLSWAALGVVYVVWGSTYLAIRVGVAHFPPLLMAGTRYAIAGALLYPIALRVAARRGAGRGEPGGGARPGIRAWLGCAAVGLLLLVAGNGGLTVGETTLPSGFAAVLVATVPLWMIVFARLVQKQRVTAKAAVALTVGLAGVAVLVGDGTASGRITGVAIVLGAAAAWGLGSVLSHRLPLPGHAMLAAAIEMLVAGAVLLTLAAASGEFSRVHWAAIPATSWIALAYLIGPGSILAFTAYGYALARLPVTTVATYAYVNPVVAVLAGIAFLGEQFTWREALGAALVIGSIVITLQRSRAVAPPAEAPPAEAPPAEARAAGGVAAEALAAEALAAEALPAEARPAGAPAARVSRPG